MLRSGAEAGAHRRGLYFLVAFRRYVDKGMLLWLQVHLEPVFIVVAQAGEVIAGFDFESTAWLIVRFKIVFEGVAWRREFHLDGVGIFKVFGGGEVHKVGGVLCRQRVEF